MEIVLIALAVGALFFGFKMGEQHGRERQTALELTWNQYLRLKGQREPEGEYRKGFEAAVWAYWEGLKSGTEPTDYDDEMEQFVDSTRQPS